MEAVLNPTTEEDMYKRLLWLNGTVAVTSISWVLFEGIIPELLQGVAGLAMMVAMGIWTVIFFKTSCKNKIIFIFFKLYLSGIVLFTVFTNLLVAIGFPAVIITLIAGIFANRKRFKYYGKYKSFLTCYVILTIVWFFIYLEPFIELDMAFEGPGVVSYSPPPFWNAVGLMTLFLLIHWLFKKEQARGRKFLETMRIFYLFPTVFPFLLVGFTTLIPIPCLSGKSIFGEGDQDYFALEE